MTGADIAQLVITSIGAVVTVGGVYGVFRHWQGKVDERLNWGSKEFEDLNSKCGDISTDISGIKTDISAIKTEVKNHEKRLDRIEVKLNGRSNSD